MNYDRVVRWLHAGMALAVVIQMLSSLVMHRSRNRDECPWSLSMPSF